MKSILCYGDSNTWGMVPMTSLESSTRHPPADRWPRVLQERLGSSFSVIDEGLNGRTTVFDDPIDGRHKNGRTYLLPCLESHAPLNLVIIMLGTNDLKSRFNVSPYDVAAGVGQLVKTISPEVRGQNGIKPEVLLVCPAHIGPLDLFADAFAGAPEKSRQLHTHYRNTAELVGCHCLNAADHVRSSAVDGVHLEAPEQHALGLAIAERVQALAALPGSRRTVPRSRPRGSPSQ
jgi:lysophospholipase L1-like esterase